MNAILPRQFVSEQIDPFAVRYFALANGHLLEVLEVCFKGTDYSLAIDGVTVFEAWRKEAAQPKIAEVFASLAAQAGGDVVESY